MNRTDFIKVMDDPSAISPKLTAEIDELIGLFPYFQGAYMLMLKGLRNNDDLRFENRLRQNAIYVANRASLYYLLNSPIPKVIVQLPENKSLEAAKIEIVEVDAEPLAIVGNVEQIDLVVEIQETKQEPSESIHVELLEIEADDDKDVASAEPLAVVTANQLPDSYLIDKFLAENPKITPSRDKQTVPQPDISKPYTEQTDGLVSETLAKIYIKQEYYSRAIDIYEKLCLKYPEKSSYFASQIKSIKELINS